METIEERADDYVGQSYKVDEDLSIRDKRLAYKVGAHEQLLIDITHIMTYLKANKMVSEENLDKLNKEIGNYIKKTVRDKDYDQI